jgi:iron complex outermembrane receptor protein
MAGKHIHNTPTERTMKLKTLVSSLAVLGFATHALAQEATQRVVVTGSSIKRIQAEGALPMDVYTADDMARNGIQTAEQLVQALAANGIGADSEISNNNVFGQDTDRLTGGATYANLRGLGSSATLVLINGRRLATHGMSGGAVDLNAIPTAAVARVEVLRDGASAIYGADAIGGVINFILKTDFQGFTAKLDYNEPLASGGGTSRRLSFTGGKGSLERDGYNVMAALSIDKTDILRGKDRDFVDGFQPERGLSPDSSSHPFANILNTSGSALPTSGSVVSATDPTKYTRINLLALPGQQGCDAIETGVRYQPQLWNVSQASAGMLCNTDYGRQSMLAAAKQGYNFAGRGTLKVGGSSQAFMEFLKSRTTVYSEFTPFQFSTTAAAGNFYPVSGPYYLNLKSYGVASFDPTKPISYRWRMQDFGLRKIENISDNMRLALGAEGDWGDYSYRFGLSTASSNAWRELVDGYTYSKKLNAALKTGIINPWVMPGQTQTQAARDLIESTKAYGRLDGGHTTMSQLDGSLSGPLMKLPGGAMEFAVGLDLRKETYEFAMEAGGFNCISSMSATATDLDVMGCPGNSAVPKVSRDVSAAYAELMLPLLKSLEVTLAVRHDQYSGSLGGTTNPKVAFAFRPLKQILLRGSYNTGFKAPTFQQMIANTAPRDLTSTVNDPTANCAAEPDKSNPAKCSIVGMDYTSGGDPNLKPETSEQATLGLVVAPIPSLTLTADYWRIDMDDRIRTLTVTNILDNYDLYSHLVVRDAAGNMSLINSGWINAADSSTEGVDWSVNWTTNWGGSKWTANVSGTHMLKAEERSNTKLPMVDYVGKFNTRTIYLKDKVNFVLSWDQGDWRVTGNALYKSGYMDQNMNTTSWKNTVADPNNEMGPLTIYGLYVRYNGIKNTSIQVGVSNLLDTKPPFSHHNVDDVAGAGYDPRYASPVGRAVSLAASYTF